MTQLLRCSLGFAVFAGIFAFAQPETSPRWRPFGEIETEFLELTIEEAKLPKYMEEFTPVEGPIDPDSYVLGPGDLLGISILTGENLTFVLRIGPTGDLLIPSVGIVKVAGLTLAEGIDHIRKSVTQNTYRNSVVDVTLINVRRFRLLTLGGVREPGFITATATDRLTEVISSAGGLHKYADEEKIKLVRASGQTEYVSLRAFLVDGSLADNPTFQEGDRIEVPFLEAYEHSAEESITYNESAILVTGFVNKPGAYRYFPGYTVRDYIGMAGGVEEMGSQKKVSVYRSNTVIHAEFGDPVEPGDTVYIPQNIRYVLFGRSSMLQVVAAAVAVLLTYQRLLELLTKS